MENRIEIPKLPRFFPHGEKQRGGPSLATIRLRSKRLVGLLRLLGREIWCLARLESVEGEAPQIQTSDEPPNEQRTAPALAPILQRGLPSPEIAQAINRLGADASRKLFPYMTGNGGPAALPEDLERDRALVASWRSQRRREALQTERALHSKGSCLVPGSVSYACPSQLITVKGQALEVNPIPHALP